MAAGAIAIAPAVALAAPGGGAPPGGAAMHGPSSTTTTTSVADRKRRWIQPHELTTARNRPAHAVMRDDGLSSRQRGERAGFGLQSGRWNGRIEICRRAAAKLSQHCVGVTVRRRVLSSTAQRLPPRHRTRRSPLTTASVSCATRSSFQRNVWIGRFPPVADAKCSAAQVVTFVTFGAQSGTSAFTAP